MILFLILPFLKFYCCLGKSCEVTENRKLFVCSVYSCLCWNKQVWLCFSQILSMITNFVKFHSVPSCSIMFQHVSSCFIMFHHVLSCAIMLCHISSWSVMSHVFFLLVEVQQMRTGDPQKADSLIWFIQLNTWVFNASLYLVWMLR